MRKANTNDEKTGERKNINREAGGTATSFNSGRSLMSEFSKNKKKEKLKKGSGSYELDESIRGLPTDLDRVNGPVQPREDSWEGDGNGDI